MTKVPVVADYQAIFEAERVNEYPEVDAFEARMGFKIDRAKLESAARVLACPLKKNPPNWQHGRVLYAAAMSRFGKAPGEHFTVLDIGTAKGFSALCLAWALVDSSEEGTIAGQVHSVDVINPNDRVRRNTVAELDGLLSLSETLAPWPDAGLIRFYGMTGTDWLKNRACKLDIGQIAVALIDGKHTGAVVAEEGRMLAELQDAGDLAIFDDIHLEDVASAVKSLSSLYELETLKILPNRAYAIGVRR